MSIVYYPNDRVPKVQACGFTIDQGGLAFKIGHAQLETLSKAGMLRRVMTDRFNTITAPSYVNTKYDILAARSGAPLSEDFLKSQTSLLKVAREVQAPVAQPAADAEAEDFVAGMNRMEKELNEAAAEQKAEQQAPSKSVPIEPKVIEISDLDDKTDDELRLMLKSFTPNGDNVKTRITLVKMLVDNGVVTK